VCVCVCMCARAREKQKRYHTNLKVKSLMKENCQFFGLLIVNWFVGYVLTVFAVRLPAAYI
jgi:hypothetical protein